MSKRKKCRRSRSKYPNAFPKGAYRLPTGEIATKVFYNDHRGRRIAVIGVRRAEPDLELLAKVLVELARQQIEQDNQLD